MGSRIRFPDYGYTLLFPSATRDAVIDGIGRPCDDTSRFGLQSAQGSGRSVEVELSVRSLPDMAPEVVREFAQLPDGSHALGTVYLTIGASAWPEFPDAVEFRLWPCTRRLQRVPAFGSALLRSELIRLLERHGGHAGYVQWTIRAIRSSSGTSRLAGLTMGTLVEYMPVIQGQNEALHLTRRAYRLSGVHRFAAPKAA